MSSWYGTDEDPFEKVGYARIMLIRKAHEYGYQGQLKNCIDIVNVEHFQLGFITPQNKAADLPVRWMHDAINDIHHKINHLFIKRPIGCYELTGEVYNWSSRNYEGEWDGDTEIRNANIQEIHFHAITSSDKDGVLAEDRYNLSEHSNDRWIWGSYVHYQMERLDILRVHANVLSSIASRRYSDIREFSSIKDEKQLEDLIHMLMLQIDSDPVFVGNEKVHARVAEIDKKVVETISRHSRLMEE